jgi:peptidoglycan hydrolase CwlO-like protein
MAVMERALQDVKASLDRLDAQLKDIGNRKSDAKSRMNESKGRAKAIGRSMVSWETMKPPNP